MFLRGCSFVTNLKFNSLKSVNKCVRFNLTTSPTRRKRSQNNRNSKRCGHYTLLDKFMKQTSPDGSLIVKAPMNLKCSASFFDKDNQVDSVKNHKVGVSRNEANRLERMNRRKGIYNDDDDEEEDDYTDDVTTPDQGAGIFMKSDHMIKNMSDVEKNILEKIVQTSGSKASEPPPRPRPKSPIHLSLYGRARHRVDSYSIMARSRVAHTHVYVSDARSGEEAVSMFSMETNGGGATVTPPSGQVDIWRPRHVSQVEISSGDAASAREEVVSTFKVYCPTHLLEQEKNGISMVFHTPTLMNKIFLEAERMGCIDLNGLLMDQLMTVGLLTEAGNIKLRDIWAEEIKLATVSGDVTCHGTLEGHIRAETLGDGDFTARSVVGPMLDVVTDRGDISVWDDCHAETTQLFTNTGNIYCNRLFSDAKICIKQEGVATLNLVTGSVACVVKSGDIICHLDELTQDSFMEVETGNIVVNIPTPCPFRISLVSPRSQIVPHVLNNGEFCIKDGLEYFVTGGGSEEKDLAPVLTVRCHRGLVSLQSPPVSRRVEAEEDGS